MLLGFLFGVLAESDLGGEGRGFHLLFLVLMFFNELHAATLTDRLLCQFMPYMAGVAIVRVVVIFVPIVQTDLSNHHIA
jgi:hypothetical protein